MSDQLMEQLAILEQQRLESKNIVAVREQEYKINNTTAGTTRCKKVNFTT